MRTQGKGLGKSRARALPSALTLSFRSDRTPNTGRQAAGAVGVAAFGALAAKDMLAGMRTAFGVSAALLAAAGVLAAWSANHGDVAGHQP